MTVGQVPCEPAICDIYAIGIGMTTGVMPYRFVFNKVT